MLSLRKYIERKIMDCKTCRYYRAVAQGEQSAPFGYCFFKPPLVLLMPQASPVGKVDTRFAGKSQDNYTLQPASVRPLVREGDFCSEWKQQTH